MDTFHEYRHLAGRNPSFDDMYVIVSERWSSAYNDEERSNEDCCNEMFAIWLSKDSTASWKRLFAAIESIEASQSTWLKLKGFLY